jgi:hypothetical protein
MFFSFIAVVNKTLSVAEAINARNEGEKRSRSVRKRFK